MCLTGQRCRRPMTAAEILYEIDQLHGEARTEFGAGSEIDLIFSRLYEAARVEVQMSQTTGETDAKD